MATVGSDLSGEGINLGFQEEVLLSDTLGLGLLNAAHSGSV